MQTVKLDKVSDYLDFLQVDGNEYQPLFNTILINVTEFFRDPEVWEFMREEMVPKILQACAGNAPIRVWSAGCASGEEAYSLAILLTEQMGAAEFKKRVKIYATDVDEEALNQARQASYGPQALKNLPTEIIEKYFEAKAGRYIFDRDIRRCVIFGRHDLVQDAPISRVDLLLCRNALIYLNSEAQERIFSRFHFALGYTGFLVLGKAETLISSRSFVPVDVRHRVFAKSTVPAQIDRFANLVLDGKGDRVAAIAMHNRIHEAAFDLGPVAQIGVDLAGHLANANQQARELFDLSVRDLGRPLQDLTISYRPLDIRSPIDEALTSKHPVSMKDVEWIAGGERVCLDVDVSLLCDANGIVLGTTVIFRDVTKFKKMQAELVQFNQELETTNEELQSTNEELETINEELQSTNEELETINEEVRLRSDQSEDSKSLLEAVLGSLAEGVIVLDSELRILVWNDRSFDLWGLREDEVKGQHLMNLDIGLPVEHLMPAIRDELSGNNAVTDTVVQARSRRGKLFQCRVSFSAYRRSPNAPGGVILVMRDDKSQVDSKHEPLETSSL
jgi:two-component system CheB/CheR fusion protein